VGNGGKIYAMALSADNHWLAVGGWMAEGYGVNDEAVANIRLYDFASGTLVALLKGHRKSVVSLAFSPNGRWLVSGAADSNAILWDVKTQTLHQRLSVHPDDINVIYAVAFTPDSQRVVTGGLNHSLNLWRVADGYLIQTINMFNKELIANSLIRHRNQILDVVVAPNNRIIAGSLDHSIRFWDGDTGRSLGILVDDVGKEITSLGVSTDGAFLLAAVGLQESETHLYRLSDGKRLEHYREHDNIVLATALSPNSRWAAAAGGSDNSIHIWPIPQDKRHYRLGGVGNTIWAVGFDPDSGSIFWGKTLDKKNINHRGPLEFQLHLPNSDAPLRTSSLGSPQRLNQEEVQQNTTNNNFIRARSHNQDWRLTHQQGGYYNHNAILNIERQNETVAQIIRDATTGYDHRAYTFTRDSQSIISGGSNGALTLYDRNGNNPRSFIGHTSDVWSVAVSADGRFLVSGSADHTVRLWNVETQELLMTLFHGRANTEDAQEWVTWTPQGYYSASVNGDSMIGWQINRGLDHAADYVTAAQLKKHFYRPDIIADALRLGSAKLAVVRAQDTSYTLADLLKKPPPRFVNIRPPHPFYK